MQIERHWTWAEEVELEAILLLVDYIAVLIAFVTNGFIMTFNDEGPVRTHNADPRCKIEECISFTLWWTPAPHAIHGNDVVKTWRPIAIKINWPLIIQWKVNIITHLPNFISADTDDDSKSMMLLTDLLNYEPYSVTFLLVIRTCTFRLKGRAL